MKRYEMIENVEQRVEEVLAVYGRGDISRRRIRDIHGQVSHVNRRLSGREKTDATRQLAMTLHKVTATALRGLGSEYGRIRLQRKFGESPLKDGRHV